MSKFIGCDKEKNVTFINTKGLNDNFLSKKFPNYYKSLSEKIKDMSLGISERIWIYQNGYTEPPKCCYDKCDNAVKFTKFYKGYNKYCSRQCSAYDTSKNEDVKKSRLKGIINSNNDPTTRKEMTIKANSTKKDISEKKINSLLENENYTIIGFENYNITLKCYDCDCDNKYFNIDKKILLRQKKFEKICVNKFPKTCYISSYEKSIWEFLENININFESSDRIILKGRELDVYIPSHNLAIEMNGLYYHSDIFKPDNYHLNKTNDCLNNNIQLIHIFEDEWLFKQDIVKSRLKNLLGHSTNKIFARKCDIRVIEDTKLIREFLDKNHIQGFVNSKIKLGLYYNDELVSLMTFGKLRKNLGQKHKKSNYELLRFCNILNTNVIGAASKLFKYFIRNYNYEEIISYADRRWSEGHLYETLGFDYLHTSRPNYFYVNGNNNNKIRENRWNYRKDILVNENYDKNKTERCIMQERGYYRIYDSGVLKYVYKK